MIEEDVAAYRNMPGPAHDHAGSVMDARQTPALDFVAYQVTQLPAHRTGNGPNSFKQYHGFKSNRNPPILP